MSLRTRTLTSFLAVGLIAAACSGANTTPAPSTAPSVTLPSPSASASMEESPGGSVQGASAMPSESAGASGPSGASESAGPSSSAPASIAAPSASAMSVADLQAALPTQVAGKTLTIRTGKPSDIPLFQGSDGQARFEDLVARLGVDASSAAVAVADASDHSITIVGLSIPGADPGLLPLFFVSSGQDPNKPVPFAVTTVGGKTVTRVDTAGTTGPVYVYATGSNLFVVRSSDEAAATEAVQKLP